MRATFVACASKHSMARHDSRPSADTERKRDGAPNGKPAGAANQVRHGGYGMDSIRRNLRAQLEQRRLGLSPWDDDEPGSNPRPRKT
ncbi:hypothetical protein PE066_18455 [Ramlibacter tataouinensis]|uniref:hypothetical protein n=1 Tax=Ramlibacter tataouinensis TaxID=94132 RepID=UPI0022F3C6A0|nr:hypothetical protein [Ramlibacter tataouinensis]WBY01424.1 hypothetical protein PE066_18455 [Ramlibacter tataouinensis]